MRFLPVLLSCLLLALVTNAQTVEICNDGKDNDGNGQIDCADSFCNFAANIERGCRCFDNLDNDGDGLIDKADPNCASYYGLTFVGEGSTCSLTPPGANTPFDLVSAPAAVSGQNTSDTQSKIAIGDIDGDGIPDAAITSKFNSNLRIVATSGTNANPQPDGSKAGDIKSEYNINGSPILPYNSKFMYEHDVLIADINKDGKGEIFGIISDRPPQGGSVKAVRFFLVGFTYSLNTLTPLFNAIDLGPDRPGIPGIADFDGDGKAEIYMKDEIYAAESGVKLADGGGDWDTEVNAAPVAVNIIAGTPNMELVTGKYIYNVPNLTSRTLQVMTIAHDMSTIQSYFPKVYLDLVEYGVDNASSTSVADLDEDGFLDVVLSGSTTKYLVGAQVTSVFYWNVQKNKVSVFNPPDAVLPNGWTWGTSRINLGDANGDGKLNLSFVAGNRLFCLMTDASDNLVPLWATPRTINDSNSGIIAVTIYDFVNDGTPELVYRDSQEIVIVDGATGQNKLWFSSCKSHTFTEGPIIADVNGDGGTDICAPCFRGPGAFNINGTLQEQARGEVRLWFSTGNEWLPTRKVWNQPGYFVVNINDNLTLPFPQLDQTLVFGNTPCPNGVPGPNQPFNVFLNQVPRLSADGCPIYPAPDLAFFGDDPANPGVDIDGDGVYTPAVVVTPPICGNLGVSAFFNIVNSGDLPITDTVPVAFFNGDPLNGGTYLHNSTLTINNLQVGQTLQTPPINFNGPGTVFTLYIVLYSNGTLPLVINNTKECSIANNTYQVLIAPNPFTVTIEKVSDNFKCDNTAPDTGELRAHIFKGGVEVNDLSPYSFQWYSGPNTSTPIPGPAGTDYLLTDRAEGDYTLVVTDTQKGCAAAPVTETIVRLGNDPEITINVLSDQTLCSPANGQLEAVITGGNTGFTFEWFDISLNPLGIVGPIANNLTAGNYLVRVSKSGCVKISNPATVNGPQIPDAQAQVLQHVVDCSNPNSGVIQADALFNGVIQNPADYQFDWYFYNNATSTRGSILPPANGSGQTRTGLAAGFYQAEIKQLATQCVSTQAPIVEVLNQTVIPVAVITQIAPQTSCDPANPNGILTADAFIGGVQQNPASFTFQWFKGDNTLPASLHSSVSDVNGKQANNVSGGGQFYTVKIITANNCVATEKFIIAENVKVPVVTLSASTNSICDPAKASSNYNGGVSATVTFDGAPVADFTNYKFTWHQGQTTGDPVIAVANDKLPSLSQLNGGYYTVVVQRLDLFCTSVPVTVEVLNVQDLPVIVDVSTPSTHCAGGTPNGIVSAEVDLGGSTTTTGYTFTWYAGNGTAGAVVGNTAAVPGQQGGLNYTVEVVNNTTGCANTLTILLPDNKILPVLSLMPNENSICDATLGFNGFITSSFVDTNGSGGHVYNYAWSTGTDMTSPIGGQTAASLTGRNGGFYTATVTNATLNCVSSPVTTEILNNQILPVINTTPTPSTNCVGGAANGSIDSSVDVGGTPTTAGFSFNWFTGNLTTDPAVPATPNNGNTFNPIQLQGGQNFTVEVRNSTSGCINTKTVTLPDNKALPVLTLNPNENSICDPTIGFNGFITSSFIDANGLGSHTYSYAWSTGTDMSSIIGGQSASSLVGRDGGFYTASITNATLNCTSSPVTTEIINNQILPVINTALTPSTNCAGGTPNGEIDSSVDVGGTPTTAGFSFNWFTGNLTTDPPVPAVPNNGNTFNPIQLQGGQNFTVEVRNSSSGCINTKTVTLPDNKELPVLTLNPGINSICDPGIGFDGSITSSFTDTNGLGGHIYTYAWSTGTDMSSIIGGETASSLTGRDGGFYSGTITNATLNCTSSFVTAEIQNVQVFPTITTSITGSSNCAGGAPDGQASVTGVVPADTYIYKWYQGVVVNPGAELNAPAVPTISGLQGGVGEDYIVEVTLQSTGCKNTSGVLIPDISELPVLSPLSKVDNTLCVGTNGQALIGTVNYRGVVASPYTGYTLAWSTGASTPNITGLAAGNYSLTIRKDDVNCTSTPVSVDVNDDLYIPVIDVASTPQTSCVNPRNGELAATIDETLIGGGPGVVGGYNFTWYDGSDLTTPTPAGKYSGTPGEIVTLDGNLFYTVHVQRLATGCENTKTQFLQEIITIPTVALAVNSQQTACAPPDGQITATVNPAPVQTYTYYWLKEQPFTTTNDAAVLIGDVNASPASPNRRFTGAVGANTDVHNQLTFGNYTMVAFDDRTQCVSQPVTATVQDQTGSDVIFNIGALPTSCATNNGALDIRANRNDAMATTFTFEVFIQGPTNPVTPIDFNSNPPQFDPVLNPPTGTTSPFPTLGPVANNVDVNQGTLSSSIYSVIATDAVGCKNLETFFLPFQDAHDIDALVLNSQICPYTIGDGSISVRTIPPPTNLGANQTQFTYSFYAGGVANPANLLTPPGAPAPVELCANGIDDDGDGLIDGADPDCTNPFNYPPSTEICNNGIDDDGDGLIDGADPDCTNRVERSRLAPGFYTIEVQENISGALCKVYEVIEIQRDALPPLLDIVGTVTPNTACNTALAADGSVEIMIAKDPNDNTVGSTYTLGLGPLAGTEVFNPALGALPFANPVITGLQPDTNVAQYTITVTSSNNCSSQRFISVPDQPTTAELVSNDVVIRDAEYCNPLLEQSARVVVNDIRLVGGGVENIADYQFDWFTDIGLLTNVFAAAQGNPAAIAGGDEFINNVPAGSGTVPAGTVTAGSYWIRVTKTADASGTGGIGCFSSPLKVDLVDHHVNPQATLTPFSNTACDGNFEGSIVVDAVTPIVFGPPDLSPGNGGTYAYTWTSSVAPPPNTVGQSGVANSTPNNLQDGNYTLTATNEVTGCATMVSTTILKVSPPVFTMSVTSLPQELCTPHGTARVTDVFLNGVSDGGTANFNFNWFRAAPNTPALVDGGAATIIVDQIDNTNYLTIGRDDYYVIAIRRPNTDPGSGCASAPTKVTIDDTSVDPVVSLTPFFNTACDTGFEGRINTTTTTQAGTPGAGATYQYSWTSTSTTTPVANPAAVGNEFFINLEDGDYMLTATNNVTSCFASATATIIKSLTPIVVASATPTDQELCSPDGSILVNDITVNGVIDVNHNNFDFTWYKDSPGNPSIATGVNNDLLDIVDFATIGVGTYYVKARRLNGINPGSGCESAPLRVEIEDVSVDPVVSLTPFFNTACDTGFEGRINTTTTTQAGTPGAGATYVYAWTSTSTTTPAGDPAAVGNEVFTNLEDGDYILTATNNVTSCFASATTTIVKSLTPIVVANATPTDQQLCTPDGAILVNDITVNGVVDANHNNFDFTWFKDSAGNPAIATGVNNDFLDITDFATIGVGTYFVKARRLNGVTPGSGCESAPLRVEIKDISVDPAITFNSISSTSCDNNFDGQITVNASTTVGPGVGSNYDLLWTAVPIGSTVANATDVPSPYSTFGADIVGPGDFTVQVTNRITQCFASGTITMISTPQPLDILTVNKTDQAICFPDGSIAVNSLNSGVVGNYSYQWFRNDPNSAALVDGGAAVIVTPTLDVVNYPSIGADTYFVVATKNPGIAPGSGCVTPPFRVDILDTHLDPRIQFTYVPNSSCDPVNPNGMVIANAAEQSGANGDNYSFTWTLNSGALPPFTTITSTNNSNQLDNASDGNYVLVIQNTSATGCQFTSSLAVEKNLNISLPNIIDANTIDPLDCLASGSATVTRVGIGGITFFNDPPDDLDLNFDYKWFQGNLGSQLIGEVNHNIVGRLPGTYYVTVQDATTLCESGPKEVVIDDDQIIYPAVNIVQTARQISCMAATGTAALASTADGQTDANLDYQFAWYPTLDATGASFANTSTIIGQGAGNYSVDVLRVSTGCSSQALYIVPDEAPQFTPVISLGGQGRTLCVGQDGLVLARVIDISLQYPFPLNFTADLFNGSTPNLGGPPSVPNMANVPGFATNFTEGSLAEGFYTVRITDNNTGCFAVATQEVLDQRVPPEVVIKQDNPLTNCDPAIANGQLSATADGGKVGGYTFSWHAGTAVATPPQAVLSAINKLIAQGAGDYVVRVTNKLTGCFDDLAGVIEDNTVTPPVPQALTEKNRTNCLVPNGIVTASVGDNIIDYIFNWYDGTAVSSSADFSGVRYTDLDVGSYTVTATDIVTRCVSPPATTPVLDERLIPQFVIETTPSFCMDTGRPKGNGSVLLTLTNNDDNNIALENVTWVDTSTNQPVGDGTALYELFPGFYRANAITFEGCSNEGVAEVKTEISPYNGVSNNSDGQNDAFIVDCISLFPNNNVKIFNRNGIKVYEADGYNNGDIAFIGMGINGLYLQGKELPVGTYFYVIDKRDGSKPVAGYLELDR